MAFSDPNYYKVSTLCHFDGANDSTTVNDEFGNPYTVYGNGKLSTTQKKYGSTSFFCNTSGYLWIPFYNTNLDLTIEFYFYTTSASIQELLFAPTGSVGLLEISLSSSKMKMYASSVGTTYDFNLTGTATISQSTWYHVACVKSGTSVKLYLNGTLDISGTLTSSSLPIYGFYFGSHNGSSILSGYLDELRSYKDLALYTSNFTAPSTPFPSWTKYFNIVLNYFQPTILGYYPLSESSGSTLSDTMTLYPLTISGSPTFSQTPLATWTDDTSITFNGGSASGTFPSLNVLSEFSVVFFIKTSTSSQTLISKSSVFSITIDSSGYLVFTIGGSSITSSVLVNTNTTKMIGCSFEGSRLKIFIDGVLNNNLDGSFSIVDNNTQPLVFGPLTGTLDEVYLLNYKFRNIEFLFWYNLAFSINPTTYNKNKQAIFLNENIGDLTYNVIFYKKSFFDLYFSYTSTQFLSSTIKYSLDTSLFITIDGTITVNSIPASRKVLLLDAYSFIIIKETWSDSLTGYYSFSEILNNSNFVVFCKDYESGNQAAKTVIIGVPTNLDPLSGSSISSPITSQFSGYISSFGIFKVSSVEQSLIDNLFYSSNILGSFKIEGETYINNTKTEDISVLLLDSSYNKIKSTVSDVSGNFSFLNIHYASYYILTTVDSLTNVIKGPILPTPM